LKGYWLESSAIILAGGFSSRFGQDKSLLQLGSKPLVLHVLDRISGIADQEIVVVSTEEGRSRLQKVVEHKASVLVDEVKIQTPLAGAYTGFNHARNEYSLLLSCDTPFINAEIAQFLIETCVNKAASIPRWPQGHIEPLQAVYHTKSALIAAKAALDEARLDMNSMIERMREVRYISTLVLEQLDPKLCTFFNINTQADLKNAESLLRRNQHRPVVKGEREAFLSSDDRALGEGW
jgi:molybdopterin-guanine dinucleotide biosynthesis protein A